MKNTSDISILPATPAVLREFWDRTPPRTVRAWYATDGQRVLGVAGVYRQGCAWIAFADMTDEVRSRKRIIVAGLRRVLEAVSETTLPVWALCDPAIPGADVLLRHMGFEPSHGNTYRLAGH